MRRMIGIAALAAALTWIGPAADAQQFGNYGTDYSANKPTLPNVGANFAASGPYASYALIATVPANLYRGSITINNNSTSQLAIVVDDGTAASGAAPTNATVFSVGVASVAGGPGGTWYSTSEKGRVQVYAASGTAQVSVRAN